MTKNKTENTQIRHMATFRKPAQIKIDSNAIPIDRFTRSSLPLAIGRRRLPDNFAPESLFCRRFVSNKLQISQHLQSWRLSCRLWDSQMNALVQWGWHAADCWLVAKIF